MRRRLLISTAAAVLVAGNVFAQTSSTPATPKTPSAREETITEMIAKAVANVRTPDAPIQQPFASVLTMDDFIAMYFVAAAHDANPGSDAGKLIDALLARASKQLGSTSPSTAGTTIASKGLVPDILGVALESGAVNQATKGTTLTFQVTPMGVVKALQGKGLLDVYADYSTSTASRIASRFAVSASFDTSRGTAGTFTADDNQLSAWSVRAKAFDGRDPSRNATGWTGLLNGTTAAAFDEARRNVTAALRNWKALDDLRTAVDAMVDQRVDGPLKSKTIDLAGAENEFHTILTAELPKLLTLPSKPPAVTSAIDAYVAALARLQTDIDAIYDFADKGPILTIEWATSRDKALPDLYTVTGIYEMSLGKTRATDFTVNAVGNFYKARPTGVDHTFKSFDLNAELDHPLGQFLNAQALLFTLAARYSYLPNDTVASTATPGGPAASATMAAPALKGSIAVIQFKFTLPLAKGVKIPLSITASNRTELIKEKDVRASFGITFDLDSVLGIVGVK